VQAIRQIRLQSGRVIRPTIPQSDRPRSASD
jgi:hypothetical protein